MDRQQGSDALAGGVLSNVVMILQLALRSLLLCVMLVVVGLSAKSFAADTVSEKQEIAPLLVATEPAKNSDQKPAEEKPAAAAAPEPAKDSGGPEVHLLGLKTDVARRYRNIVPPLPFPPFSSWRRWFKEHEVAVHCLLEWRDDEGKWWHGELRSTHFDPHSQIYRVGFGEFPGTAYDAYGIYIVPGRQPREIDERGRKVEVALDEVVNCDYHVVESELRNYGAKYALPGDAGTGGGGHYNVGLGGPAYKPAQNSNTMVNYVLQRCGVQHPAPDLAVGWDRIPHFPYSTNAEAVKLDCVPER